MDYLAIFETILERSRLNETKVFLIQQYHCCVFLAKTVSNVLSTIFYEFKLKKLSFAQHELHFM